MVCDEMHMKDFHGDILPSGNQIHIGYIGNDATS